MRKEYVKTVSHITSSKEEYVKFKDATNIQEAIAKNARKNMSL